MACQWQLGLVCDDPGEADHASHAAFEEIDRLELELSRFVESSDIARIADLEPGGSLLLGDDAFTCLEQAVTMFEITRGVFDVSLATGLERVRLDRREHRVTVDAPVSIDLGGIGKGYTVDAALRQLDDWDLASGWITCGQSTVRAFGGPHPVAIRDPNDPDAILATLQLDDRAFSGSGTRLHGQHIIDPRTGEPAGGPIGAWAFAPDSATSDALSTTFMIVTSSEIRSLCDRVDGAGAVWLTPAGELQSCGAIRGSLGH